MSNEETINELSLLLLYFTSWEEKSPFGSANRSWKGYPFETLDELTDAGYISGSRSAKSVYLELCIFYIQYGLSGKRRITEHLSK